MATTEQQRRWRQKKASNGLVRFDAWVPADRVGGLKNLISDCIADPDLRVIGLRSRRDEEIAPDRHFANDDGAPGEDQPITRDDMLTALAFATQGLSNAELLTVCDLVRILSTSRD